MKYIFIAVIVLIFPVFGIWAQPLNIGTVLPTRQTPVHDPVLIREKKTFYLFCTGWGISVWSSKDLKKWEKESPVFDRPPAWAVKAVPGFRGHIWAPDISFQNGQYYLYYSVSTFGKNTSCIGLATNKTLDPHSSEFSWIDHGKVIQSVPGRDLWNAIDPNLALDERQEPWLVFGSFWDGIKLVRLNPSMDAPAEPGEWYTLASRHRDSSTPDTSAGKGAIEAPFLYHHGRFYYLFVSVDYCCRGAKSTYKVVVGRSESIQGPYYDKAGLDMRLGGGSLVAEGGGDWYAVGHNAVVDLDGKEYILYHGYDRKDRGRSKLIIRSLGWDSEGWPQIGHGVDP